MHPGRERVVKDCLTTELLSDAYKLKYLVVIPNH